MNRRNALSLVLLLALAATPCLAKAAPEAGMVFFVRHAEKAQDDPKNPSLSEAGEQRAEALARLLSAAEVTHLFASEFRRTRDTLAPLAKQRGLEVQVISAQDPDAQKEALLALPPGSVAVVAGHSNTVPGMVRDLGGDLGGLVHHEKHGDMLGDDEYHRLFLVILPGKGQEARTLELRYGR
jgi:phosphohistidine phosphatase SixA